MKAEFDGNQWTQVHAANDCYKGRGVAVCTICVIRWRLCVFYI